MSSEGTDPSALIRELLQQLRWPGSVAELLVLRGDLAMVEVSLLDEVDRALGGLSEAALLEAALLPGGDELARFQAEVDAAPAEGDRDARELAQQLIGLLEDWGLRARGLEACGRTALADGVRARRLAALAWLSDHEDLLLAVSRGAATALAASPLGARSAWALVLAETAPPRRAGPSGDLDDLDLLEVAMGTSTPDQDARVGAALRADPGLLRRMARLEEELALLDGPGEDADGDVVFDGSTLGALVIPYPPPGEAEVLAVAVRERLEDVVLAAAAADADDPPELEAPAPEALIWVFATGPRLFVERAGSRWVLRLLGVGDAGAVNLSGPVLQRWDRGRTLWALLGAGAVGIDLGDERTRFTLGAP